MTLLKAGMSFFDITVVRVLLFALMSTASLASLRWYSASNLCMAASCSSVMDPTLALTLKYTASTEIVPAQKVRPRIVRSGACDRRGTSARTALCSNIRIIAAAVKPKVWANSPTPRRGVSIIGAGGMSYPPVRLSSMLLATSSQTDANSSISFLMTASSSCSASCRYMAA